MTYSDASLTEGSPHHGGVSRANPIRMRSLFYLTATLVVVTAFFPAIGSSAEHLILQLLELANDALASMPTG